MRNMLVRFMSDLRDSTGRSAGPQLHPSSRACAPAHRGRGDATIGADDDPTELLDVNQVFICITGIFDSVTTTVCSTDDVTKMRSVGDNLWAITIWPPDYFDIPDGDDLLEMSFYFTNNDETIEVKIPTSGNDFRIFPTCN